MASTGKNDFIACLRSQLQRAEERQRRWDELGIVMRTTNAQSWNTIAILRREEVEQFRVLVEWAENKDLPDGSASSRESPRVPYVTAGG